MNKKNSDIYLSLNSKNLSIAAFDFIKGDNIYFKEYNCYTNFSKNTFNIEELEKNIESYIFDLEKNTNSFLNDLHLMIDSPDSMDISLSLMQNNEGREIQKEDVKYLIQYARQQILSSNKDVSIAHIIVEKYIIDDDDFDTFPNNLACKKFSIDVKFICFPKFLIKRLEELFSKNQILLNRIICTQYVKAIKNGFFDQNICERGRKLVLGANKQEVLIIPKSIEKKGFFERLFHLFK
tara:strand:+ start:569 stop:1279 length:711 start_codon:yes stop_codon:yes gene_type:complete